ncbi:hypothetical protein PTKIN_Ptkin02bG0149300 [Pterospermum kingtungense]
MEEKASRSHLKRQYNEDEDSNKPPAQKRVRFPKGKKVKPGEKAVNRVDVEDGSGDLKDPRIAAKERAKRRSQITTELFTEDGRGMLPDVSAAEATYENNENFVDDGIQIEPFNLSKEREEGYFDAQGNFVEYVGEKEIKDAWLDSVEADVKYTGKTLAMTNGEDNNAAQDLSTQDIGLIKRRITNVLEPGETVLQALRRLKGASNNKKERMSAETKRVFDQLTEDAMKLMENGDYNVYHEKQEVFRREAEGYEKLACARGKGISADVGLDNSDPNLGSDILTDINNPGVTSALPDSAAFTSNSNITAAEVSSSAACGYDMFADDEDDENIKRSSEPNSDAVIQSSAGAVNTFSENGDVQNDYVYDESSGYYYSSTLGYYYDPSTGLYCSAASGKWYSFNEVTGTYDEVQEVVSCTN